MQEVKDKDVFNYYKVSGFNWSKRYDELYNKQLDLIKEVKIPIANHKMIATIDADYKTHLDNYTLPVKENPLYKAARDIINLEYPNKQLALSIIQYFNKVTTLQNIKAKSKAALLRSKISYREYGRYIRKFFNKVHELLAKGHAYKMSYGISTIYIGLFNNDKKDFVDWEETKKRKQQLIDRGLRPYNAKEAAEYEKEGIPYDGVKYVVYKNISNIHVIRCRSMLINNLRHSENLIFKPSDYINGEYRGNNYNEMLEKFCKTDEDIFNMKLGIYYKVALYNIKYPLTYLEYERNEKEFCNK